jgi:hypothetical protein
MTQYRVLASEGQQRYINTKTHKNIKEKKVIPNEITLQYSAVLKGAVSRDF